MYEELRLFDVSYEYVNISFDVASATCMNTHAVGSP